MTTVGSWQGLLLAGYLGEAGRSWESRGFLLFDDLPHLAGLPSFAEAVMSA